MNDAVFDAESSLYVLIRFVQYVGLLLLIGVVTGDRLLARTPTLRAFVSANGVFVDEARRRARHLGVVGLGIIAISMGLRLIAQAYAVNGGEGPVADAFPMLAILLQETLWGRAWWLQLAATGVSAIGLTCAMLAASESGAASTRRWRARARAAAMPVATTATLVMAFTPALASHAMSSPGFAIGAIIADGLHVIGAGGWLGTLAVLIVAAFPATRALGAGARGAAIAVLVRAFSPVALGFATMVVLTGTFAAWLHLRSFQALWHTPYGSVLLWKLAALSLVFGTGAYNWRRVLPTLGSDGAAARLGRSARAEVTIAVVVVVITAVLVATPTARMATM